MAVTIASLRTYLERNQSFNKVILYNSFGNGDIFESREFAKAIMELIPADEYSYAHTKNPRILLDIPELKYIELTEEMNPRFSIQANNDHNLLINTWIGITGRYVLPGIGCTVEKLYEMYNDYFGVVFGLKLPGNPVDYIPDIDYSYYDLDSCNKFLKEHTEEKIFIDNGLVMSKQAENFPFADFIYDIARRHKDKCFIVTNGLPKVENVFTTDYITKRKEFDLPEISYLSTFCSTLIGRNSGPHVFTQVKRNVMDETKKLLSFTYQASGSSFVVNTDVKIRKYWSDATDTDDVVTMIERVLNE